MHDLYKSMKEYQLIELVRFYWPDKAFTPHPAFKTLHKRKNRVASVGVNFLKHAMVLQVYGQVVKTQ